MMVPARAAHMSVACWQRCCVQNTLFTFARLILATSLESQGGGQKQKHFFTGSIRVKHGAR